jgi:hypothetical protein
MFRNVFLFSLVLLLLSASGCQQFREFFSRDSEYQEERTPRRRSSRREQDDSADRDPIRDMFKIKNKPVYMHDKYLTPQERAILQEQLHGNDPAAYKKSFRSTYKDEQKKRQDWVFSR